MTDHTPLTRRLRIGAAALGLLVVGGVGGTVASHALQPAIEMAPLRPVAIAALPKTDGIVTVRGRVVEIYGNKFVVDDGSGRTLVDTGRAGDDAILVATGAPVTVQGRFDRGFVHASFLVDAAGKVTALRPMGPPDHGPGGRHGPRDMAPPQGDDAPPAPPATGATASAAVAPPAAAPAH